MEHSRPIREPRGQSSSFDARKSFRIHTYDTPSPNPRVVTNLCNAPSSNPFVVTNLRNSGGRGVGVILLMNSGVPFASRMALRGAPASIRSRFLVSNLQSSVTDLQSLALRRRTLGSPRAVTQEQRASFPFPPPRRDNRSLRMETPECPSKPWLEELL